MLLAALFYISLPNCLPTELCFSKKGILLADFRSTIWCEDINGLDCKPLLSG